MLPFGIGLPEILVCLVVVLLVVGPQKLPDMARTLGKGLRTARRAGQELKSAIDLREPLDEARRSWESHVNVTDAELYDNAHHFHDDDHGDEHEGGAEPDADNRIAHTVGRSESVVAPRLAEGPPEKTEPTDDGTKASGSADASQQDDGRGDLG